MNGIIFGKEIRNLRNKNGFNSKELSKLVNKGEAYISQLENGKIKNPDFETSYKLLKTLGITDERIEEILNMYNIRSIEQQEAELKKVLHMRNVFTNAKDDLNINFEINMGFDDFEYWYSDTSKELKQTNDKIYHRFNVFIDKDLSRAKNVITNLEKITTNMDDFHFLCLIFSHNYSKLSNDNKKQLLDTISNFMANVI